MPETVECGMHGKNTEAFVCAHLKDHTAGLGFNRNEPTEEDPFPDAWCDACEALRAQYGGWDDVPEGQCEAMLLCSECYERTRIRNIRPSVTLDDLSGLRWKCSSCDEWHTGPCLDFGFSEPSYWNENYEKASRWANLVPRSVKRPSPTFLDLDYCSINSESFFVRGLIQLPIIGTAESFRWGVWGSLSQSNFETLLKMDDDPKRVELPPMFSWLSSQISDYPNTLSLKMYAHIQEPGSRPHFRLEPSDHPLSLEYFHGISPARVKEIMFRGLPAVDA